MTKDEVIQKSEEIGGLSSRVEKEALWDLGMKYIKDGGIAIEVGTWTGGSAVILGEVCRRKNARLLCIDAFSADMHGIGDGVSADPFRTVVDNTKELPIDFMAGDSNILLRYVANDIADFIFIDGDHHLPAVKIDVEGYWPKLKTGGLCIMHDWGNLEDVRITINNFLGEEALTHVDSAVWVEKKDLSIKK